MNRTARTAPERNSMRLFLIRDYRLLFSAQIIALFGTGLATVALGLLAYELAGPSAGAVLATALTIKMSLYVVIAPLAAAYVDRLPRRAFLVALDVLRAAVVIALPFVSEIWHIYVLVGVLQAASAAFTPTFQAVIPDIVTDEADFTRALSASQVAYTMESLLSPVLAAVALSFMTFNLLFVATSVGFAVSALLVLATRIPNARPQYSPQRVGPDRVGGADLRDHTATARHHGTQSRGGSSRFDRRGQHRQLRPRRARWNPIRRGVDACRVRHRHVGDRAGFFPASSTEPLNAP